MRPRWPCPNISWAFPSSWLTGAQPFSSCQCGGLLPVSTRSPASSFAWQSCRRAQSVWQQPRWVMHGGRFDHGSVGSSELFPLVCFYLFFGSTLQFCLFRSGSSWAGNPNLSALSGIENNFSKAFPLKRPYDLFQGEGWFVLPSLR